MKKKILLLLLIPILALTVVGCTKKEEPKAKDDTAKIELADSKLGFKTTFEYPKDENYTDLKEETGGASKEITFKNEDLDVEFQMYYNTMRSTTYDTTKEGRSNQKYYKEYKFGKYEAYAYGEYDDGIYLNVLLGSNSDGDVEVLFVSIDRLDNNKDVIVSDVLNDTKLQDFFKSMKFEHTK